MAENTPHGFSYRLSTQDATFIYAESDSGPLHIGSIGLFEGRVDFESILTHIESRIHLVPRYRQRLTPAPFNLAHATMEDDPEFSVRNHVFRHEIAPGSSEDDAIEQMLEVYEKPLDRALPLWELHSYEGLTGGRTAIMWKVHHCLVDGVSGVELLKVMYDFRPDPEPVPQPEVPWVPEPEPGYAEKFNRAVRDAWSTTTGAYSQTLRELWSAPAEAAENARMLTRAMRTMGELSTRRIATTPWNASPVGQKRTVAWTRHPFAEFRAIRQALGGSLNDVVLAILTEGAARYLDHHGYDAGDAPFCVGCPVNVRMKEEKSTLGNRVSMMFPTTPAKPMDVTQRLTQINEETERIKAAGEAQALEVLTRYADMIPPTLMGIGSAFATRAIDATAALAGTFGSTPRPGGFLLPAVGINFIATNVPGVQVPQFLCGHRCLDMIPLVPVGSTLGFGVAILSYNQNLYFGMVSDPRLMPDIALMKGYVDEAFADLRRRAMEQAGFADRAMAAVGR